MGRARVPAMSGHSLSSLPILTSRAASCLLLLAAAARGQTILPGSGPGGEAHLFNTDSAVLESQDPRKDLPCTSTPVKPTLGFDLKFHSGYEVNVPLKELSGQQNLLTMIYRVTPAGHPDEPVYMSQ